MLSPARGPSFRGLEHSQIVFFRTIFVNSLHAALEPLFFGFLSKMQVQMAPQWLKNKVKNRVKNLRFPGSPKISSQGKVEGDLGPFLGLDRLKNRPQIEQTTDRRPVRPNRPQTTDRLQQTSP